MAKKSVVQRNLKRIQKVEALSGKRQALKKILKDKNLSLSERLKAQKKITEMPRDSSKIRIRNRCELTGRGHGYIRQFKLSRIMVRELASFGLIPGLRKGSW